mgnify:CR=1 FL=1
MQKIHAKHKILFIINPIAGGRSKLNFKNAVDRNLDKTLFDPEFVFSENIGHAKILAFKGLEDGFKLIVAVGGDGTVNEVATAVMGSEAILGIVPFGSGNGLARHLDIPMNIDKAIRLLNDYNIKMIDTASLNDKKFFNMSGVGFDAHISLQFAALKGRGFQGYITTTLKELSSFKSSAYSITIDGKEIDREAFLIAVANSTQWGNNAHVAPTAEIEDGLLDVCIIKPFKWFDFPELAFRLFSKTAHHSPHVEILKGKEIKIMRKDKGAVHIDGEPLQMGIQLNYKIDPSSLSVAAA